MLWHQVSISCGWTVMCGIVLLAVAGVVSTFYAMREALALVGDEGLSDLWDRHLAAHQQLWQGLTQLGLEPFVPEVKDR